MLLKPPLPPMEARSVEEIPAGNGWPFANHFFAVARFVVAGDNRSALFVLKFSRANSSSMQERRAMLEEFARENFKTKSALRLSPATTNLATAKKWFAKVGGNLDGIIAKELNAPYGLRRADRGDQGEANP